MTNLKKKEYGNAPLEKLIDKLITIYGWDKKFKHLDAINGWEEMMGTAVANRTERVYIRNRVLHVKMNSSVLRDELALGKEIIVLRVNEFVQESIIDEVWFE